MTGMIGVEQVEEHEDGSATYQFHLDNNCAKLLQEEGLKLVLYCAAAKLDLQVVYDFIEDHIRQQKEELTEYVFGVQDGETISPMTEEERKRAKEKEKANNVWRKCVSCGGPAQDKFCGFCLEEE